MYTKPVELLEQTLSLSMTWGSEPRVSPAIKLDPSAEGDWTQHIHAVRLGHSKLCQGGLHDVQPLLTSTRVNAEHLVKAGLGW